MIRQDRTSAHRPRGPGTSSTRRAALQTFLAWAPAIIAGLLTGCAGAPRPKSEPWPRYTLQAAGTWRLNSPGGGRFDASGLFRAKNGDLLTVSDRGPSIYRIRYESGAGAADLVPVPGCFTPEQLAPLAAGRAARWDCEGITGDDAGRLYLCEEENRWILRCDPGSGRVERLDIDWSPVRKYFSRADSNASFEGVAFGAGNLYVANERDRGRIIVVDLRRLKVVDDFEVRSSVVSLWGPHYSDLSWFGGDLYVLMREDHVVLRVEPRSGRVLAEYDFRSLEFSDDNKYRRLYPFVGVMEGLAVDREGFWLATDNNGLGREKEPSDTRPTLFHCPRPDRP